MPDANTVTNTNTVGNVAVGKPKITGGVYRAPLGSTLPTDAVTELDAAFVPMGYISDEGVINSKARETTEIKAWGGDTVLNPQTSKTDTFKMVFIESKNINVLKTVHGDDNVTGVAATGITVRENSQELDHAAWVIETVMGNEFKRIVIADGMPTEIGDVVYKDDEAVAYDTTITAYPSDALDGDTHREYIKTKS